MRYKNSSTYVSRQTNRILRQHRHFVKTYVNDIVIFSKTLTEHVIHLQQVFNVLTHNNISINCMKTFFDFSFVNFLEQHVISFEFLTGVQKLHAIANLIFSRNFTQFETYFELID